MATQSPMKRSMDLLPENLPSMPETAALAFSPAVNPDVSVNDAKEISTPVRLRQSESSSSETNVITIPSYARWFSWDKIHQSEQRFLPEFFSGKSPSKNSKVYKYYRDTMIQIYRQNPSRKITFTEVRKAIIGDVGSVRRVFDFLEGWGLINYAGSISKPPSKGEDKENRSGGEVRGSLSDSSLQKKENSRKFCSGCQTVCSIACFVCDKYDLTVCARCFVRRNYRDVVSPSDFKRVEISEETKIGWTDKETLHLLEAVMHYGDDWKKVSEHVGGRTEIECIARFIKLPFGEQFLSNPDSDEVDKYYDTHNHGGCETEEENVLSSPPKRRRLTPFADASNPIMAQAAFLSAMVGSEVAEAAAQAAVAALSEVDLIVDQRRGEKYYGAPVEETQKENHGLPNAESAGGPISDVTMNTLKATMAEAQTLIKKEEQDLENSITGIIEVQMREIQDKIIQFEEVELQMEKEWQQLQHMKDLLFADQMALFIGTSGPLQKGESTGDVKTTNAAVTVGM